MTAAPFDTLKLSRQLRMRALFDQEQAEGVAGRWPKPFKNRLQPRPILHCLSSGS
jgi:hypothetical protein